MAIWSRNIGLFDLQKINGVILYGVIGNCLGFANVDVAEESAA